MHTYNFTCNVLDLICDEKPFLNASAIFFLEGLGTDNVHHY